MKHAIHTTLLLAGTLLCGCHTGSSTVPPPDGSVFSENFVQIYLMNEAMTLSQHAERYIRIDFQGDLISNTGPTLRLRRAEPVLRRPHLQRPAARQSQLRTGLRPLRIRPVLPRRLRRAPFAGLVAERPRRAPDGFLPGVHPQRLPVSDIRQLIPRRLRRPDAQHLSRLHPRHNTARPARLRHDRTPRQGLLSLFHRAADARRVHLRAFAPCRRTKALATALHALLSSGIALQIHKAREAGMSFSCASATCSAADAAAARIPCTPPPCVTTQGGRVHFPAGPPQPNPYAVYTVTIFYLPLCTEQTGNVRQWKDLAACKPRKKIAKEAIRFSLGAPAGVRYFYNSQEFPF